MPIPTAPGGLMSWIRAVFGYQVITQGGIPVPQRPIIEIPTGTLTDDPVGRRTLYTPPASPVTSATLPLVISAGVASINPATDASAGSMSAADKTKLDGISGTTTPQPFSYPKIAHALVGIQPINAQATFAIGDTLGLQFLMDRPESTSGGELTWTNSGGADTVIMRLYANDAGIPAPLASTAPMVLGGGSGYFSASWVGGPVALTPGKLYWVTYFCQSSAYICFWQNNFYSTGTTDQVYPNPNIGSNQSHPGIYFGDGMWATACFAAAGDAKPSFVLGGQGIAPVGPLFV